MQVRSRERVARRLALIAGWGGIALLATVCLLDVIWPRGADLVRTFITPHHTTLHYLVLLFGLKGAVAMCALVLAAAGLVRRPKWSRWAFAAVALVAALCGVYGLHFMANADAALASWRLGLTDLRSTMEAQSWLAWAGVLVWISFALAVALLVAAVLVSPRGEAEGAATTAEASADAPSASPAAVRLAFWMSVAGLAVILIDQVRAPVWSSDIVRAMSRSAFAQQRWLAAAVVMFAQLIWLVPVLVLALAARRAPRAAWAVFGAAGTYGVLHFGESLAAGLQHWLVVATSRFGRLLRASQFGSASAAAKARAPYATARADVLGRIIVDAAVLALAVALVAAALRQYRVWRRAQAGSALATGPDAAQGALITAEGRNSVLASVAIVAAVVTLLAPSLANVLVGSGGSLLGAGGVNLRLLTRPVQAPIVATSPTPLPAASGSPVPQNTPIITGVWPGFASPGTWGGSPSSIRWPGDYVRVTYEPHGFQIDPAKCELSIDGQKQEVPARLQSMSPTTPTLAWTLSRPVEQGKHEFTVVLVTTTGRRFAFGWSYSD